MAEAHLQRARLAGLVSVVGPERRRLDDEPELYGGNRAQLDRLKRTIGLAERWVSPPAQTALDLGHQAATRLLAGLALAPADLDALIFVTQTPDHFQPCNAAILHGRLGLPTSVAAFDVNLGCSGFVYGLYLASLLAETGGCRKVLLVAGDTLSHSVHPRDRAVAPLFGDAAAAALVEQIPPGEPPSPAWFSLHTDGSGADIIKQPAGGFREPATNAALTEHTDADGNVRTRANLHMNGAEVFSFNLRELPLLVEGLMRRAQVGTRDVDAYVFHQANRYIIRNIARRLHLPLERVPMDIVERFGNQSSASIPFTLCHSLGEAARARRLRVLLVGYGVGLSWASALLEVGPLRVCEWITGVAPP